MPLGTIINILAVILGSLIGLCLKSHISPKIHQRVFQGIGLTTLLIGMQMALKVENLLLLIFSILLGAITGEAIDLEKHLDNLANRLKKKLGSQSSTFTQGLITAFLIFCIGSLTILGALDEGIRGDHTLLLTKSTLDGFTSIALSATYGLGVMFSVIPMLIYQGGITLLAGQFQSLFTPVLINQLTAVGGILILGLGLNLLEIKQIKITNMLPALVIVFLFKPLL
ncbi:DUF554 domain-containing protein [Desulfohalobiaceae bacterium Ax17]|uniref:DUF554 domain-containing protein n=1 Tax=Desulfovulcanus ferrireducens TaxID=2831190 RepID=UPI00207BB0AF|nr:DUF554 domain-containing protein [Desulfovulcanus ferrireducens]MBT8762861.1 DUF554 domain-containing protein [Desulfovulcanus ferrireducens]